MYRTITEQDFIQQFEDYNRQEHFSYEGLRALFNCFEELESATGEYIELDVIAICCDFTEYSSLEEVVANYTDDITIEELHNNTLVIEFDGGLIVQDF